MWLSSSHQLLADTCTLVHSCAASISSATGMNQRFRMIPAGLGSSAHCICDQLALYSGSYAPRHPTGASHKNWPSSGSAPKASAVLDPEPRAADFSRGSVRPGSAPPMGLRSRGYVDAAVLRAERVVYMEAHNGAPFCSQSVTSECDRS